jgi:hypothetical protein
MGEPNQALCGEPTAMGMQGMECCAQHSSIQVRCQLQLHDLPSNSQCISILQAMAKTAANSTLQHCMCVLHAGLSYINAEWAAAAQAHSGAPLRSRAARNSS